jgi:tRNA wybutosine-synthesizing protein 3
MDKFKARKEVALKALSEAEEEGVVDRDMIPLIERINSLANYCTTSSCTGRISLFHDMGIKKDNGWVEKWHRAVTIDEVCEAMKKIPSEGLVWFMQEPTILHVVCRTIDDAGKMIDIARDSGYKKVGILSLREERIIAEVCSTERIDAPIADNGTVLVPDDYIEYLVDLANRKFKKSMVRLERFKRNLGNMR